MNMTVKVVEIAAVVGCVAVADVAVKAEVDSFVVSTVVGLPVALGERGAGDGVVVFGALSRQPSVEL